MRRASTLISSLTVLAAGSAVAVRAGLAQPLLVAVAVLGILAIVTLAIAGRLAFVVLRAPDVTPDHRIRIIEAFLGLLGGITQNRRR